MLAEVIFCALAAAGIIFVFWVILGLFLLPMSGEGLTAVLMVRDRDAALFRSLRAYHWLQQSGMTKMRMVIVDCGMSARARQEAELELRQSEGVCLCSEEELLNILHTE